MKLFKCQYDLARACDFGTYKLNEIVLPEPALLTHIKNVSSA